MEANMSQFYALLMRATRSGGNNLRTSLCAVHISKMSRPFSGILSDAVGFRGRKNIMAWLVAGSLAYYLYVVPERKRAHEQQMARELARRLAEEKGLLEIDRAAPRADPQDTGLLKGKKE